MKTVPTVVHQSVIFLLTYVTLQSNNLQYNNYVTVTGMGGTGTHSYRAKRPQVRLWLLCAPCSCCVYLRPLCMPVAVVCD